MSGEGPGAESVAIVGREFSVLRGATAPVVGILPGRYPVDALRATIGNRVFSDLVSIGDIRLETEGE